MWFHRKKSIGSVTWEAKPLFPPPPSPTPYNPAGVVSGGEMLILKRISFLLSLRLQQPGIFERRRHSPLLRYWLYFEVGGHVFEHNL